VLHDEGGNLIGPVIHDGRPDRGMPAFPALTKEQIADIGAFLRSRKQATSNRFGYVIQGLVTGDAKAGAPHATRRREIWRALRAATSPWICSGAPLPPAIA